MAKKLTDAHLMQLTEQERAEIRRARAIASWMDDKLRLGNFGVGLDGVIGVIPVAGDLFSASMAVYHLYVAKKLDLGGGTMFSIMVNTGADFMVGLVPVIGDLLDFTYRSHRRNMKLIEARLVERLERTQ